MKNKKWIPLRNNFIVKIKKEEKSAGGIIIPGSSKEHMAREDGEVIALGPDMFIDSNPEDKDQIKIGDIVAFARYGGKQLGEDDEGNEIRALRDIDAIAKIEV